MKEIEEVMLQVADTTASVLPFLSCIRRSNRSKEERQSWCRTWAMLHLQLFEGTFQDALSYQPSTLDRHMLLIASLSCSLIFLLFFNVISELNAVCSLSNFELCWHEKHDCCFINFVGKWITCANSGNRRNELRDNVYCNFPFFPLGFSSSFRSSSSESSGKLLLCLA